MVAVKLRGRVTTNKQLVVKLPKDIAPGEVEVILLHEPPAKAQTRRARRKTHPAFGMWANRKDITDSGDYAAQLRRKVERREDGR
jgi:hypothetical protein